MEIQFRLSYIPEGDHSPTKAISEAVEKLQQLIQPARPIEAVPVRLANGIARLDRES